MLNEVSAYKTPPINSNGKMFKNRNTTLRWRKNQERFEIIWIRFIYYTRSNVLICSLIYGPVFVETNKQQQQIFKIKKKINNEKKGSANMVGSLLCTFFFGINPFDGF